MCLEIFSTSLVCHEIKEVENSWHRHRFSTSVRTSHNSQFLETACICISSQLYIGFTSQNQHFPSCSFRICSCIVFCIHANNSNLSLVTFFRQQKLIGKKQLSDYGCRQAAISVIVLAIFPAAAAVATIAGALSPRSGLDQALLPPCMEINCAAQIAHLLYVGKGAARVEEVNWASSSKNVLSCYFLSQRSTGSMHGNTPLSFPKSAVQGVEAQKYRPLCPHELFRSSPALLTFWHPEVSPDGWVGSVPMQVSAPGSLGQQFCKRRNHFF